MWKDSDLTDLLISFIVSLVTSFFLENLSSLMRTMTPRYCPVVANTCPPQRDSSDVALISDVCNRFRRLDFKLQYLEMESILKELPQTKQAQSQLSNRLSLQILTLELETKI